MAKGLFSKRHVNLFISFSSCKLDIKVSICSLHVNSHLACTFQHLHKMKHLSEKKNFIFCAKIFLIKVNCYVTVTGQLKIQSHGLTQFCLLYNCVLWRYFFFPLVTINERKYFLVDGWSVARQTRESYHHTTPGLTSFREVRPQEIHTKDVNLNQFVRQCFLGKATLVS